MRSGLGRGSRTVLLWLLVPALVLACSSGSSSKGPARDPQRGSSPAGSDTGGPGSLKVGLLVPLTGGFAGIGRDVNQGFQLYLEQHGGRLGGFRVETIVADDASLPQTAQAKLRRLVEQDRITVLAGLVSSPVALALRDYIDEHHLVTIDAAAGADDLTQRTPSAWIFRTGPANSQEAHALGDYACRTLGYRRAVVIAIDDQDGWEASGGFAHTFKDCGGAIAQEIYVPLNTADWAPFVQKVDADGADVVMAVVAGDDAIRFLRAYRDFGVRLPLVGPAALTDELSLVQEGDAAAGIVSAGHFSAALDDPLTRDFVAAYGARYGAAPGPGQYAEGGYLAARVLDAALAAAGAGALSDPALLRVALQAVRFDGTTRGSAFSFDAQQQGVFDVYLRRTEKQPSGRYVNAILPGATYRAVSQFWTYPPAGYLKGRSYDDLKGSWAK